MPTRKILVTAMSGIIAVAAIPCVYVTKAAYAEETGALIRRLSERTEQRGYKNTPLRPAICESIGWTAADCKTGVTSQIPTVADGIVHAFEVTRIPSKAARIVILVHDKRIGSFFWTDIDGTLRACLRAQLGGDKVSWVKISCEAPEVLNQFSDEIAFWRTHEGQVVWPN